MLHACERAPCVIDDSAFHCGLQGVEDAHAVIKGQSHHQALLWQITHMGNGPVVHPTACQHNAGLQEEGNREDCTSKPRGGGGRAGGGGGEVFRGDT